MGNMMQDQLPNTEESDELLKKIFKKNSKIFPILEPGESRCKASLQLLFLDF